MTKTKISLIALFAPWFLLWTLRIFFEKWQMTEASAIMKLGVIAEYPILSKAFRLAQVMTDVPGTRLAVLLVLTILIITHLLESRYKWILSFFAVALVFSLLGRALIKNLHLHQDISKTFGHAVFNGTTYGLVNILILLSGVGSILFAAWWGRKKPEIGQTIILRPINRWIYLFFFVPFFFYIPNLNWLYDWVLNNIQIPLWDWDNMAVFEYHAHFGDIPYRDYFFPYSGNFIFSKPYPMGEIFRALSNTFLVCVSFYTLLKVFRSSAKIISTILILIHLSQLGWFSTFDRMFVPIALLGGFLFWYFERNRVSVAIFFVTSFWCLFLDPTQVIYTGAACFIATVVSIIASTNQTRLRSLISLWPVAIMVLINIGFWCLTLIAVGAWQGFSHWILNLSEVAKYMAVPSDLNEAFKSPLNLFGFYLWIFCFCLAMATRGIFSNHQSRKSFALLAFSFLGLMALQKFGIRSTEYQIFYAVLISVALLISHELSSKPRLKNFLIYLMFGLILGSTQMIRPEPSYTSRLLGIHSTINSYLQTHDWTNLNNNRFSENRFRNFTAQKRLAHHLKENYKELKIWLLSDDPVVYLLLDQKPPYISNVFNLSPLSEQKFLLQQIMKMPPHVLILRTDRMNTDGIQNLIRMPKLFQYAIENYAHQEDFEDYQIFVFSPSTSEREKWLDVHKNYFNLGALPLYVRTENYSECSEISPECGPLIEIKSTEKTNTPIVLEVVSQKQNLRFQMDWKRFARSANYPLVQLPIWQILYKDFNMDQLHFEGLPKEFSARVKLVKKNDTILY